MTSADCRDVVATIALTPTQRRIADRLAQSFGRFVGNDALLAAMYGNRADGGPMTAQTVLKVEIHRLRKRLAHTELTIESSGRAAAFDGRRLTWRTT